MQDNYGDVIEVFPSPVGEPLIYLGVHDRTTQKGERDTAEAELTPVMALKLARRLVEAAEKAIQE